MWFTSNCEAVGEGLLYIASLGRLKMSQWRRNSCKQHVKPEGQMRVYWVIRGPHYLYPITGRTVTHGATMAVPEFCEKHLRKVS